MSIQTKKTDVLLISMPFGQLLMPSIGLSLIKSSLERAHISAKILYFTFEFSQLIDTSFYQEIASGFPVNHYLVGEWIFSSSLFLQTEAETEAYISNILVESSYKTRNKHKKIDDEFIRKIYKARLAVNKFLDLCCETIIRLSPKVIAFTSIFQQQISSLSLAKKIKEKKSEISIIFGGANCEGIMGVEMIKQFPFIDYVISGEGEIAFPALAKQIINDEQNSDIKGVYCYQKIKKEYNFEIENATSIIDMDSLPIPDYSDYFSQLEDSNLNIKEKPRLLFETARGCWWGQKHHCTFCGLNGSTMNFRSKSATRALDELLYLSKSYPGHEISVVDNILDMNYFRDFIPTLASQKIKINLFYEVKANLRKRQILLLRDSGIKRIQPGIESLSNKVLTMMSKGVKALQNIQLLKWCKEYGIIPEWNILWGFPGEPPEEYEKMTNIIPLLTHLKPPGSAAGIRLDRFSPNFNQSQELGFKNVIPYPAYSYIYKLPPQAISNLAYFFSFEYEEPQDVESYTRSFAKEISNWISVHENSDLFSVDKKTHLLIWDLRPIATDTLITLTDHKKDLYQICDEFKSIGQLERYFKTKKSYLEENLNFLLDKKIMLKIDDCYLSLALPLGEYSPSKPILEKFIEVINSLGEYKEAERVTTIKI